MMVVLLLKHMLLVMFKPEGLAGMWQDAVKRLRNAAKREAVEPAAPKALAE